MLKPLSLTQSLNGEPGVVYVDSMNFSTSAGRPYNTIKRDILQGTTNPDGSVGFPYQLQPAMYKTHIAALESLSNKRRTNLPFKSSLKDEPIKPARNSLELVDGIPVGKGPRLFMASNIDLTILVRMFYLPYARIAQRNPFVFLSAPGMNPASHQWLRLRDYLIAHGANNIMAGDYSDYDMKMMALMTEYAFRFMQAVLFMRGGYSTQDKVITTTLMYDVTNPNCDVDGDHIILFGSNPSGHPLTVHVNCLANIFYVMASWLSGGNDLGDFFQQVSLMTYGDDNIMGIRQPDKLNYLVMQRYLKSIGVVYTRSDKSVIIDASLDSLGDVEFLKRGFRTLEYDGREVCFAPLNKSSIFKTLDMWVRSKVVSKQTQAFDSLSAVWYSTLMHSDLDSVRDIIATMCEGAMSPGMFPSYEQFMEKYFSDSIAVDAFFATPTWAYLRGPVDATCHIDHIYYVVLLILNILLMPMVEERIKRMGAAWNYGIVIHEYLSFFIHHPLTLWHVIIRTTLAWLHLECTRLPYWNGVAVHTFNNFVWGVLPLLLYLSNFTDGPWSEIVCKQMGVNLGLSNNTTPAECVGFKFVSTC